MIGAGAHLVAAVAWLTGLVTGALAWRALSRWLRRQRRPVVIDTWPPRGF